MILVRHGGFGAPKEELEVEWPTAWRLPAQGEHVFAVGSFGGWIEYVSWDLIGTTLRAYLR